MRFYYHTLLTCGLGLSLLAQAERPNILLIFSDDHAQHALSCYGNKHIETPGLDRIATEGIRFDHALTPNSFCTPARAAALTGKYSHKNGVTHLNQLFDGSQQTFPKLLQSAGYSTALFGKWHLLSQPTGFDHYCVMKMQGMPMDPIVFEPEHKWEPWSPETQKTYNRGGRRLSGFNNDAITDEALKWLDERASSDPFCLLLHPKPPHEPYEPAPPKYQDFLADVTIPEPATLYDEFEGRTPAAIFDKLKSNRIMLKPPFEKHRKELRAANPEITDREMLAELYQIYIKGYYRLVKSVDDNVGRVLDYLDEKGLAENTLVIYTSDQGFSLGEHGFYNKQWMYEKPLHQPLLMRLPGQIKAGQTHGSMVNHIDLSPTILDYAEVEIPGDIQGHSLRGITEEGVEKVREASYYHFYKHNQGLPEMIGIRTVTHKLIHYPGLPKKVQWEMFDLVADPDELKNLYQSPSHQAKVEELKKGLRTLIAELEDPVDAPQLVSSTRPKLIENLESGKAQTLVTFGTSLTAVGAWVNQLESVLHENYGSLATVINSARGGANSDWGIKAFQENVIDKNPDTVMIEFAINDANTKRNTDVAHARKNLEMMLERLSQTHPDCEVILSVMNSCYGQAHHYRPNLNAYYQMYREVAEEKGLLLIDHLPGWDTQLTQDPAAYVAYMPDEIHPTREGAQAVILPTIMRSLGLTKGTPGKNLDTPCWSYIFHQMDDAKVGPRDVTRAEYDAFWQKHLERSDVDANGTLSRAEYQPDRIFDHFDTDSDGTVTLTEFQATYAPIFAKFDTNQDGILDTNEVVIGGKGKR